jgi:hypothetical protein
MDVSKQQLINGVIKFGKMDILPKITDKTFKIVLATGMAMLENNADILDPFLKDPMIAALLMEEDGLYETDDLKDALINAMKEYGDLKIKIPGIKFISPEDKELSFNTQDVIRLSEYIGGMR